ncbi:Dehydrogenase RED2 [Colletotrichum spinosum]|uniref:Dehydrogenase RED2 n=1 Tax=Colletotrichum spinosum TaxID=1347390 RepID=A0A4V3HRD4_9PEZI|nr:Dehydrogenase RED2 [Colletotrichum spinosum]
MTATLNQASIVAGRSIDILRAFKLSKLRELFSRHRWAKYALSLVLGLTVLKKANDLATTAVVNNLASDRYDWRRELVLVAGGSGPLGDRLVRKLAKNCIKVVSVDIVPPKTPLRECHPHQPPHQILEQHSLSVVKASNAYFYQADVTASESVRTAAAARIRDDHGHPTVLVNNAAAVLDEPEAQIRRVFDVNVVGAFLLVKEFLPHMASRDHGHVVTLASTAGSVAGARNVDCACAEAAALAFHEGLGAGAAACVPRAEAEVVIRPTYIHPTYIRTPLIGAAHSTNNFKGLLLEPDDVVDRILKQIVSGRSGHVYLPPSLRAGVEANFQQDVPVRPKKCVPGTNIPCKACVMLVFCLVMLTIAWVRLYFIIRDWDGWDELKTIDKIWLVVAPVTTIGGLAYICLWIFVYVVKGRRRGRT